MRDEEDSDEEEDELESEKSPPMMVPMADILNHVANNNAHLDFGKESLKMVAVRDIAKVCLMGFLFVCEYCL